MVHCVLIVVMVVIRQCGLELLHHPLYSSNLALSDFHDLLSWKDSHRGQTFDSDDNVLYMP